MSHSNETPPRHHQPSTERPDRKPVGLLSTGFRKVAFTVLCSSIGTAIWNVAPIKQAILYACSAVVHVGGDPLGGKDGILGKLESKIDDVLDKQPHIPPVVGTGMYPAMLPGFAPKSPEQLKLEAEQKEAERLRKEKSEITTLLARAEAVKFDCDKDWPLEKMRVEVPLAERRAAEEERKRPLYARAEKLGVSADPALDYRALKELVEAAETRAEEETRKKPLYQRADKIGLTADPALDYKSLRQLVEAAERELAVDANYQAKHRAWEDEYESWRYEIDHGPNAQCPYCRFPMKVSNSPKGQGQCRRCLSFFPKVQAKACFVPPQPPEEPVPPKKNPNFPWRIFK